MKITIEPEGDENLPNLPGMTLEHVQQFALCGVRFRDELFREPFRRSVIGDANELAGLLKATTLDVLDHKAEMKECIDADSD